MADPNAVLADCPLVVTCTPASSVVLQALPRPDAFIAAVGAFTPQMVELSPELCRHIATQGTLVLDTRDADHEAGDLLQAGLDVTQLRHAAGCAAGKEKPADAKVGRCCSRAAAGPAGIWQPRAWRCRSEDQVFGSVTPRWPWYLPPRSL